MAEFSDFIVFVDESGDHSLTSIDKEFPAFALSFCVVKKEDYLTHVSPAVQRLKFKYWGHDAVILHENEIRKTKGDFSFFRTSKDLRESFLNDLSVMMANAPISILGSIIDKNRLVAKYPIPWSPYRLSLQFCLEALLQYLLRQEQRGRIVHVMFECRGKEEDADLELEFHRIIAGQRNWGWRNPDFSAVEFRPIFAKKSENSAGLQLADLTARPLALKMLRPDQENRAFEIMLPKIRARKTFP